MPNDKDIILWMNEHRLNALYQHYPKVENELQQLFDGLYEIHVPADEQEKIEKLIQTEQEESDHQAEESRRFSLLTITQSGESVCYENDNCRSFFNAALWVVEAWKKNPQWINDDGLRTDPSFMQDAVEQYQSDPRIILCAEINHDKGHMRVWCEGLWMEFSGDQLTKAVHAATRKQNLTDEQREEIFESNINEGIQSFNEHEDSDMGIQMQ